MEASKVTLSDAELALAMDPQVMVMKNAVVDAVYGLFGRVAERQREILSPLRPRFGEVFDLPPKISRGEKYRGLPYVMLDHPRSFTPHDILAVRTLFWWGHFFSVTLHLRGRWLERFEPVILASRARWAAIQFMPHSSLPSIKSAALTAVTICGVRASMIALVRPAFMAMGRNTALRV